MRTRHAPPYALLGLAGSGTVLVGGLVTSVVPASSWAAGLPLRDSSSGRMVGLAIVVLGLGLLAIAWIRLWRSALAGMVGLTGVRRACALWVVPLLGAPPLFSRDGWSYAAQGMLVNEHLSPYVWGPGILTGPVVEAVDPRWMLTPAPYGPIPLAVGGVAAEIGPHPWALVIAHRLLAVVGLAALGWALPRLASWTRVDPVVASAMVLPSPLVLAHGVGGLHNDMLMVGLGAAGLAAAVTRGWAIAAVLVGLAAAVKLPGGLIGLGVVLVSLPVGASWAARMRRGALVATLSAATLVLAGLATGLGTGWIEALAVPALIDTPLSLTAQLEGWVPGVRRLGVLTAVTVLAWYGLRGRTGSPARAVEAVAVTLSTLVVLGPVVHAWYALWCLPFVAVCRLGPRRTSVLVWTLLALGVTAPLDSSLEGAHGALLTTGVLVVGTVGVLTWASLRPSVPTRARPASPPPPAPNRTARHASGPRLASPAQDGTRA